MSAMKKLLEWWYEPPIQLELAWSEMTIESSRQYEDGDILTVTTLNGTPRVTMLIRVKSGNRLKVRQMA